MKFLAIALILGAYAVASSSTKLMGDHVCHRQEK